MTEKTEIPQQLRVGFQRKLSTMRKLLLLIGAAILVLFAVLCFGTMEEQVTGNGTIEGIREYQLKTLVSAKISKVYHQEGDRVESGELLVEFDTRDLRDQISALENDVKALELEINTKKLDLELLRKDPLPEYYRNTKNLLDGARAREERTRHELEVYRDLCEKKTVTRREFLAIELEEIANQMEVRRLEADWARLQSGMEKQIIEKAEEELKLLEQRLANKRAECDMAKAHLDDYLIKAPDAGVVTDIPPREGTYFDKGQVVVKFAADQHKKVVALISEKQIYKVQQGQVVRIYCNQYNYLDYGFFEGRVEYVDQLPQIVDGQKYYPVKILLTNEAHPLKFGAGCEVRIVTGRTKIIYALMGLNHGDYIRKKVVRKR